MGRSRGCRLRGTWTIEINETVRFVVRKYKCMGVLVWHLFCRQGRLVIDVGEKKLKRRRCWRFGELQL